MTPPNRPETTLFMLMSVDGKISTGDTDERDFDLDLPKIAGVKEGLPQYYEIEKTTDYVSLNTGRTMVKIGANTKPLRDTKVDCCFVIVDNKPHLNTHGVEYLLSWVQHLYLVTTNHQHPAYSVVSDNLTILDEEDLSVAFRRLKEDFQIERITIQSGGTLNAALLRADLIDHLKVVVAPALVGGKDTSTLVDGESLLTINDLHQIKALKLRDVRSLQDSYVSLSYDVIL